MEVQLLRILKKSDQHSGDNIRKFMLDLLTTQCYTCNSFSGFGLSIAEQEAALNAFLTIKSDFCTELQNSLINHKPNSLSKHQ